MELNLQQKFVCEDIYCHASSPKKIHNSRVVRMIRKIFINGSKRFVDWIGCKEYVKIFVLWDHNFVGFDKVYDLLVILQFVYLQQRTILLAYKSKDVIVRSEEDLILDAKI